MGEAEKSCHIPRIMISAPSSGSGKTLLTCALLVALKKRGIPVASFKCGPDYIDPMFHESALGVPSFNLDTFFSDGRTLRYLFGRHAQGVDVSVIEGAMGFYDGIGGCSREGSAWDVARTLEVPVILLVNSKGMSTSLSALIKGFCEYVPSSNIAGVIFNRMNKMLYPRIRELVEADLGIKCFGYVPEQDLIDLKSRHLGLVLPGEVDSLCESLDRLSGVLEESLDIDGILELSNNAADLSMSLEEAADLCMLKEEAADPGVSSEKADVSLNRKHASDPSAGEPDVEKRPVLPEKSEIRESFHAPGIFITHPRIAVARDEAFCFIYKDNIELLEKLGARIVWFSPVHDAHLPEADGIILYGGYPELHLDELSRNSSMIDDIRTAVGNGMPVLAECGGFMYLGDSIRDENGVEIPMAGCIRTSSYKTGRLQRFGYITIGERIQPEMQPGDQKRNNISADLQHGYMCGWKFGDGLKAHEFHYYDSTDCGSALTAYKAGGGRTWECMHVTETMVAGYPHLYYYSQPSFADSFIRKCRMA